MPLALPVLAAAAMLAAPGSASAQRDAAVVVGKGAPALEQRAASELCGYLERLFSVRTTPSTEAPRVQYLLLVGSPSTNPTIAAACRRRPFPPLSDQGFVLRSGRLRGHPALIIGGGSPRATLWAVYALAERWGARYLLSGDILPPRRAFHLPRLDEVTEPKLRVRQWRMINDFAIGPESWGARDYRPVIDQLAKMRFNRILLSVYPWQPFLDLRSGGVRRRKAWLWYHYRYPITNDMPGRRLFAPNAREFGNPDIPHRAPYETMARAGERYVHGLVQYAKSRGMECAITAWLTEFPPEFAAALSRSQKVRQLGELDVVPTPDTDIDDPKLTSLAADVLRTVANTYPEIDYIVLASPEFRSWTGQYERAWQALSARHGLGRDFSLPAIIAAAERRTDYPGGAARAVEEVKADIVALNFYDRLLTEQRVLAGTRKPGMRFVYMTAEELFPVLARVAPPGTETLNLVDYTPARIVRRRKALASIPARSVPAILITSLHDDNIGVIPQLMTTSLHALISDIRGLGWAGFSTRYWMISDHDPCVAYLARAAWDASATPDSVYRDQARSVCGPAAVEPMVRALHELERTTVGLEFDALGLTFPVPGMIMSQWAPGPTPQPVESARQGYQRALEAAGEARGVCAASGRAYVDYWIGRLAFGVGYMNTIAAVRAAATAEKAGDRAGALRNAQEALGMATAAIEAFAGVARNQSDRAMVAVVDEYVWRPLKAKVSELGGTEGR